MKTPLITYVILFYLGCAPELEVYNLKKPEVSKHQGGKKRHKKRRGKWQIIRY